MDLKLNDDQKMLKKVAADFLKSEAPPYVITDWYQKKSGVHTRALQEDRRFGLARHDRAG